MSVKKNSYHIAIDGNGYIIKGTPEDPKRVMSRSSVFGNRFASGDRDYADFSIWWFWAQTDWAAGVKNSVEWEDDAKYYYSTNIDAYSETGGFKLQKEHVLLKDFGFDIVCGTSGVVNGSNDDFVGTKENVNKPTIWKGDGGSWTEITSLTSTNNDEAAVLITHKDDLYAGFSGGAANTEKIISWDGSSWTDHTSDILTATGLSNITDAHAACELGGTLYISVTDTINDKNYIVSTADGGSTWSSEFELLGELDIISMRPFNGNIYYIAAGRNSVPLMQLREYDLTNDVEITTFYGNYGALEGRENNLLGVLNNKLLITLPITKEIWTYDTSGNLTQIYEQDSTKSDVTGSDADVYFTRGCVIYDSKAWWGNLMYDGVYFFNTMRDVDDSSTEYAYPVFLNEDNQLRWTTTNSNKNDILYKENTTYRQTAANNFLVHNEMATVSTIEKLANGVTIIFSPFAEGESILVDYSIDGLVTWTNLGTASYTLDGGSATKKTFFFGTDIQFRKIAFRIKLASDGTSTPAFQDISLRYIPIPDYKYQWSFNIDAGDNIKLLDERTAEKNYGIDIRNNLRASFLKREIVDIEDIDYMENTLDGELTAAATTITVDKTDGFPEAGRLKINNEEILYTGKTATTFTGCTRGYRGTVAIAHSDGDTVSTKYQALITDFEERNVVLPDDVGEEFLIKLTLIEA